MSDSRHPGLRGEIRFVDAPELQAKYRREIAKIAREHAAEKARPCCRDTADEIAAAFEAGQSLREA